MPPLNLNVEFDVIRTRLSGAGPHPDYSGDLLARCPECGGCALHVGAAGEGQTSVRCMQCGLRRTGKLLTALGLDNTAVVPVPMPEPKPKASEPKPTRQRPQRKPSVASPGVPASLDYERLQVASPDQLHAELCRRPQTDMGNAERLIARHGRDLRYCPSLGWLVWDGRRWCVDNAGLVMELAKATVRCIYSEAANLPDAGARGELASWAKKSESKERLTAMIALSQSGHGIPIRPEELDADPWLLNLENGTYDLRAGKLRPHQREEFCSRIVPVSYDPAADCPLFLAFLERVVPDSSVRAFLQRAIGYTLSGLTIEQCLFFLYGLGANGKSVFAAVLEALAGDYGTKTRSDTLMAKRGGGGIPNDVAALAWRRLVTVGELDLGQRFDEALVKDMTGNDTIPARFLHKEFFVFRPTFKLWLYGNHRPSIRGTDEGIWRRIRLVPFEVRIPEEERDPFLLEKLREELPGILNWALEGFRLWHREGLDAPEAVRSATGAYREEMDTLGGFLSECCLTADGLAAKSRELYQAYNQFCEETNEHALTEKRFAMQMQERGFVKHRTMSGQMWQGIGLLMERTPPPEGKNGHVGSGPHVGSCTVFQGFSPREEKQMKNTQKSCTTLHNVGLPTRPEPDSSPISPNGNPAEGVPGPAEAALPPTNYSPSPEPALPPGRADLSALRRAHDAGTLPEGDLVTGAGEFPAFAYIVSCRLKDLDKAVEDGDEQAIECWENYLLPYQAAYLQNAANAARKEVTA